MNDSSPDQDSEDNQDVNPAESSPADQGGSMLDAVLSAIEPGDKETSPSSAPDSNANTGAQQSTDGQAPKVAEPDSDLSEAELSNLHHKTRKQIHKLVSQRKDLESSVSALRPKADQYDTIVSHIRSTGLNNADLDNLFEIGTLMKKGDLFAAREKLMPFVQAIMEATGGVLPKDLAAAREAGQLSEQHARELAEARSRVALNNYQGGIRQQVDADAGYRQFLGSVISAVNDWEAPRRRSDPDWSLKAPEIQAALELAILKGTHPKSVQEAIKMAEDAHTAVEAKFKQFRPQPKSVRSISGGAQASPAAEKPKSMLEAMMQSVGR